MKTFSIGELEAQLLPAMPTKALKIIQQGYEEGFPTGVGHNKDIGWFVLQTGQGPFVAYSERKFKQKK
jgi:hypothetical protein